MKEPEYKCVSCDFYDQLEIHATFRHQLSAVIKEGEGTVETEFVIKTLITRNKEEFLVTDNGEEIRLDRIVSLTQKENP